MSSKKTTVLVVGVGSNVSQGILKALAMSTLPLRVIGADITALSPCMYTVDVGYLSPAATDPEFIDWLVDLCQRESVSAILSGVEVILETIAKHNTRILKQTSAIPIVCSTKQFQIANNKLQTCFWLKQHGFNYPIFADADNRQTVKEIVKVKGFPLIAKPLNGKGSQGIMKIKDQATLESVIGTPNYVIQEYLGNAKQEYTVGCFCDRDGKVRGSITMRRDLTAGTSTTVEIVDIPEITQEAVGIAAAFKPMGPCNIQMRLADGKPVCFEINARYSGTTPMRAWFGFNDVEAGLRHYVLNQPAYDLPKIIHGKAARYWNEVYFHPQAYEILTTTGKISRRKNRLAHVDDYGIKL